MNAGTYSEFTVMLLYKIKSGTISSPVNLVSISSSLTVSFQTDTEVTLGSCTLNAVFAFAPDLDNWLPLAVVYTQT